MICFTRYCGQNLEVNFPLRRGQRFNVFAIDPDIKMCFKHSCVCMPVIEMHIKHSCVYIEMYGNVYKCILNIVVFVSLHILPTSHHNLDTKAV